MQKVYNHDEILAICKNLPADDYKHVDDNRLGFMNRNGGYGLVAFNSDKGLVEDFPRLVRIDGKTKDDWIRALKTEGTPLPADGAKQNLKILQLVIACVLFPDTKLNPNKAQQQEALRYLYPLLQAYNQTVADSVFIAIQKAVQAFNELFYDANTRTYLLQYCCEIDMPNTVRNLYYSNDQNEWVMHEKGIIFFRDPNNSDRILPSKIGFEASATFPCFPSDTGQVPLEHRDGFKLQYMQATDMFYDGPNPTEKDTIAEDNKVGFAGLLEPFLSWKQRTPPPFPFYLVSELGKKITPGTQIAPDFVEFILAPCNMPERDRVRQSTAAKLLSLINDQKDPEFTFIEVCELNSQPLCQYFDVLKPLIEPGLAKTLTMTRTTVKYSTPPHFPLLSSALRGDPVPIPQEERFGFSHVDPEDIGKPAEFRTVGFYNPPPLNVETNINLLHPSLRETHVYKKADLDEFIAAINFSMSSSTVPPINGFGIEPTRGFGFIIDVQKKSQLLLDGARDLQIGGKTTADWHKDESLQSRDPSKLDIAGYDDDALEALLTEVIQKKVLTPKDALADPTNTDNPETRSLKTAQIHLRMLKKVYQQHCLSFAEVLITKMINLLEVSWNVTPAKGMKNTKLSFDSANRKWVLTRTAVITVYYPLEPNEQRSFIGNIKYNLVSTFKIPPNLGLHYQQPELVEQMIVNSYSKGFKPVEMTWQGPVIILNCLASYFYMLQKPENPRRRDDFHEQAMRLIQKYKPFGCLVFS